MGTLEATSSAEASTLSDEDEGNEIGELIERNNENDENVSNPRKKRKKSSPVWLHFSEIVINKAVYGQCNYCIK